MEREEVVKSNVPVCLLSLQIRSPNKVTSHAEWLLDVEILSSDFTTRLAPSKGEAGCKI